VRQGVRHSVRIILAVCVIGAALALVLALGSYHAQDKAFNSDTAAPSANLLGGLGAYISDGLLTLFGPAIVLYIPLMLIFAWRLALLRSVRVWRWRFAQALCAILMLDTVLGDALPWPSAYLPAGWGGVFGFMGAQGIESIAALLPPVLGRALILLLLLLLAAIAITIWVLSLGLNAEDAHNVQGGARLRAEREERAHAEQDTLEGQSLEGKERVTNTPPVRVSRRPKVPIYTGDVHVSEPSHQPQLQPQPQPQFMNHSQPQPAHQPTPQPQPSHQPQPQFTNHSQPQPSQQIQPAQEPKRARPVITEAGYSAALQPRGNLQTLPDLPDTYMLPPLDLLAPATAASRVPLDTAALEHNARMLETVLEDFHVKGRIVEVRPGPVVTMYELEPASGIKASRVIQLADDIARNMSALSARVATIPGRTVIGIELPNVRRETVVLHEIIASHAFAENTGSLPLVLGKNIAGDPVIADLAPMPHLLVAGTTGSGKSVGLNTMLVSLLYRLTPDQCKLILIDPKMLELSIYEGIPHLLAPVVTEPTKAIRALKWVVNQMEERYQIMASLGVRSLAGYNDKVRVAKAKGHSLARRVQVGYDAETGQPLYEEEQLDYGVLPQIVVVLDELADLMMTAGKEVEFLIQRLAQKARAAGIHLIMATQRPSVDVITGVIKANLPTRISFAVTSKIDSRTILGEQGAEQLLGKGDMLYMPSGKQIFRVHGPFISDDEVRSVTDHWRGQGWPEYINAVTEEQEEGDWSLDAGEDTGGNAEERLYRQAVQVVVAGGKASTSYVQRQLKIGYNKAANLIERMEKEGVISRPDHVGRREILVESRDEN
jgi:DNA segregation ATPase FtsK/SpoIIIE, S-DNA-T family